MQAAESRKSSQSKATAGGKPTFANRLWLFESRHSCSQPNQRERSPLNLRVALSRMKCMRRVMLASANPALVVSPRAALRCCRSSSKLLSYCKYLGAVTQGVCSATDFAVLFQACLQVRNWRWDGAGLHDSTSCGQQQLIEGFQLQP